VKLNDEITVQFKGELEAQVGKVTQVSGPLVRIVFPNGQKIFHYVTRPSGRYRITHIKGVKV